MNNRKVLITGINGFLGHNVHKEFKETEHDLLVPKSKQLNLLDENKTKKYLQKFRPDVVVHLAGSVGGIGANKVNPGKFFYENMKMGMNLIHLSKECGVKHFVMTGTICFTEDAYIKTINGYKEISNLRLNDIVIGNRNKTNQINTKFITEYSGELFKLKANSIEWFKSTPEHPFLVKREDKIEWINMKDVKIGDFLIYKKEKYEINETPKMFLDKIDNNKIKVAQNFKEFYKYHNLPEEIVINEDLAYLFGWYVAEGCSSNDKNHSNVTFYFGDEQERLNRISETIKTNFNLEPKIINCKNQKGYKLDIYSNQLMKFFKNNFYNNEAERKFALNKKVPNFVYNFNNKLLIEFIKGCFDGDGCVYNRKYKNEIKIGGVVYTSISRELIYSLKDVLLNRFGIVCSIHKRNSEGKGRILGRDVNIHNSYSLKITGNNADKFVSVFYKEKSQLIEKTRPNKNGYYEDSDNFYFKVEKIEKEIVEKLAVYNIETTDNTYIVNGIVTHNCSYPGDTPVPFKEKDLWNGYPEPTNAPYGIAKKALLVMLQSYKQQYDFNFINLLPVNMAGEYDHFDLENSHVIPAMIRKIQNAIDSNEDHIILWGDGSPTREFIDARDVSRAIRMVVDNEICHNEPINIGSGKEISIKGLADRIAHLMDYKGEIHWDVSKPNGQMRRCLDTTRAKEIIGFEAEIPLEETLKKTIKYWNKIKE